MMDIRLLEDFFQNLTVQILGLDPRALASQSRVRIEWPRNGAPAWKIDEDVAFLLVNFDDDPITRQMEVTYGTQDDANAARALNYTRVLRVSWICYGPNSFNDVNKIRTGLFLPQFAQQLRANDLALITDVPSPIRGPELFNGQWWERSSFYARFNEKITETSTVPYLQGSDVRIVKG